MTALLLTMSIMGKTSAQQVSGSAHFVFDVQSNGISAYTIYYSYPQNVTVGSNFTLRVYGYVDELTGLKLYVEKYSISIMASLSTGQVLTQTVLEDAVFLYAGARFGPFNITIPFTQSEMGDLPSGQSTNASLVLLFGATVYYDKPIGIGVHDSSQKGIGNVTIVEPNQNPPNFTNLIIYASLAAAVSAVIAGVTLIRRQGRKKAPKVEKDLKSK